MIVKSNKSLRLTFSTSAVKGGKQRIRADISRVHGSPETRISVDQTETRVFLDVFPCKTELEGLIRRASLCQGNQRVKNILAGSVALEGQKNEMKRCLRIKRYKP